MISALRKFPKCNREAVAYLQEKGFECIEESFNDVLFLNTYKLLPESPQIVPVNRENFARFRDIHDRIQGQMYWNSDRLLNNLDNWKIYLYEKNGAKYFCFFSDRDSHSTCLELGFHSVGEYVCYWKKI